VGHVAILLRFCTLGSGVGDLLLWQHGIQLWSWTVVPCAEFHGKNSISDAEELKFAPNGIIIKDCQDTVLTAFASSYPMPHTDP